MKNLSHNFTAKLLAATLFFASTTFAANSNGSTTHTKQPSPKTMQKDSLSISVSGFTSPVGVWLPATVPMPAAQSNPSTKNTPTVYLWFHGGMTSNNCSKGLIAGTDLATLHPEAIVLSTSACMSNHWWTATTAPVVDAALDSLEKRIGKTIKEVSLVGVSDGGMGIFAYSLNGKRSIKSRLFISANGSLLGPAEDIAEEPKLRSGKYRFLQGGADRLYSPAETIPWVESFCKAVQVDCELKYDPQGEHDWSYWKENRLDWVLHP